MNRQQKRAQRRIRRALKAKLEEAWEHYEAVVVVNEELKRFGAARDFNATNDLDKVLESEPEYGGCGSVPKIAKAVILRLRLTIRDVWMNNDRLGRLLKSHQYIFRNAAEDLATIDARGAPYWDVSEVIKRLRDAASKS